MGTDLKAKFSELYSQIKFSGESFINSYKTTYHLPVQLKSKLIICGMGGSGISGDYIKLLAKDKSLHVVVNKSYELPKQLDKSWSAIVISYSGNTEETLHCFHQLLKLGIQPLCISSNGKLLELSDKHNLRFILVPSGIQPRAAFPYLFGSLYGVVAKSLDLTIPTVEMEERIKRESKSLQRNQLLKSANQFINKFPIIISSKFLNCVGLRFRCQLNENSKMLAANFESPEFSHNAIVGFDGKLAKNSVLILLRSHLEYNRTKIHLDFLENNLDNISSVLSFQENRDTLIEEILAMTWKLDFISVILAELQDIDPSEVPAIDRLKQVLKSS